MASILARVQSLEKRNRRLESEVQDLKEDLKRLKRNQPQQDGRQGRGNQQPQATPPQQRTPQQQEPRQKQPQGQQARAQQAPEQRSNQGGQPQQQRTPQEPRQKQPQQRPPQEPKAPQEPRQRQQPQAQGGTANQQQRAPQQRRNDNRRREAANPGEQVDAASAQPVGGATLGVGMVGDDLLNELTQPQPQPQTQTQPQPEEPVSRTRYAIIPEDGIIKTHQMQQRPDSDSYLEIDNPTDGRSTINYRFNLSSNQAFVISQGMDRLENAFSFEKPSNRMVSRIVLQGDGVLTRTSSGWKIQEKARIDFR
ncbi:hypothetical protein [Sabulibacter ruber]|uniref:hypothetical protein n=1 Tax=Sabulibacter ruber TaxID=2811901 RepID=UPI001A9582DD|nr:hypothetical protein [Sabulibacter ruber]